MPFTNIVKSLRLCKYLSFWSERWYSQNKEENIILDYVKDDKIEENDLNEAESSSNNTKPDEQRKL